MSRNIGRAARRIVTVALLILVHEAIAASAGAGQTTESDSAFPVAILEQGASRSTMATWFARIPPDRNPDGFLLIVLLRGDTDWYRTVQSRTTADRNAREARYDIGDDTVVVRYTLRTGAVTINGIAVDLRDGNVVLVDHVDLPDRLRISGTLFVDPGMSAGTDFRPGYPDLDEVLKRSPRVTEFIGVASQRAYREDAHSENAGAGRRVRALR